MSTGFEVVDNAFLSLLVITGILLNFQVHSSGVGFVGSNYFTNFMELSAKRFLLKLSFNSDIQISDEGKQKMTIYQPNGGFLNNPFNRYKQKIPKLIQ